MNWKIFRAYDVRGKYPDEVNEDTFYRIAKAYAYEFQPNRVAVSMDARLSSPSLKENLVCGLLEAGVDVDDLGEVTSDMLYFAVGYYKYSGGLIVSASHNPKEYNGLKMVLEGARAVSSDTGLSNVIEVLKNENDRAMKVNKNRGKYKKIQIIEDYIQHILSFIDTSIIKRYKIVANGNFGFVGQPLKMVAERLKLNIMPLNMKPDGFFPKGQPDPMLEDNRIETQELIRASRADLGVSWDADADRVMFFDENGSFISGAYMGVLLAEIMLEKYGTDNKKIIFDTRVIWPIRKVIKKLGGELIISKCGHTFMKDKIRKEDALFAAEMSAHYYFQKNYYCDNGLIPMLLVLEYMSKKERKLSQIKEQICEGHYISGEVNCNMDSEGDVKEALKKIKHHFSAGKKDKIDGYSVENKTWRLNIRPSNTEPKLRLNIEAKKPNLVWSKKEEIEKVLNVQFK